MNRLNILVFVCALIFVGCGGGSSVPNTPATLPVVTPAAPIPVQASSYLNAKNLNIEPQFIPSYRKSGAVNFVEQSEGMLAGYAFADFFQDGTLSMVMFTNNWLPDHNDPRRGNSKGHVYFYRKVNGNWVNYTSSILKDQTGCITPRKVIVADFNGDGKPDVFAACHGIDRELKLGETKGEVPRFLMSQSDGSYKNLPAPISCYCHGAAAAEMNKKGYADIVVADAGVKMMPFMLINNGDGTFTPDYAKFPSDTKEKPIYTVEIIDFDNTGKFDVILAGGELSFDFGTFITTRWDTTILHNPGNNNFLTATRTMVPINQSYGLVLDIVYAGGFIYTNRTNSGKTDEASYTAAAIQKVNYKTLDATLIYVSSGTATKGAWIEWIVPYKDRITALNAAYSLNIAK